MPTPEPLQNPEKEIRVSGHSRKKKRTLEELCASLPVEERIVDLPDDEKVNVNGHALTCIGQEYDLLKDPMFLKVKFRLTREICDWVYEEMKCGESVYPQRDIPDLTPYFSKINQMRYFSKKLFEEMMDTWNFSGIDRERVKAVNVNENLSQVLTNI